MLVAKLRSHRRCPTAEKIEPSKGSQHLIRNHTFKFHKRSKDLSAKGDAEATNDDNDIVYGVLFSINDEHELEKLEREEGVKLDTTRRMLMLLMKKPVIKLPQ